MTPRQAYRLSFHLNVLACKLDMATADNCIDEFTVMGFPKCMRVNTVPFIVCAASVYVFVTL